MRPRRTPSSNEVYHLAGGTEDNALHVRIALARDYVGADDPSADGPAIAAVFEPDSEERAAIATGANLELVIYGTQLPPLSLGVTREQPLSRPQRATPGPAVWAELPLELVEDLVEVLDERRAAIARVDEVPSAEVVNREARLREFANRLLAGKVELDRLQTEGEAA